MKKWTILPAALFVAIFANAQEAPKKEKVVKTTPITEFKAMRKHILKSVSEYEAQQSKKQEQPVALDRKKIPTADPDNKLSK